MRKTLLSIMLLTLLFCLLNNSCRREDATDRTLSDLEKLLDTRPDSALKELEAMKTDRFNGKRQQALHALLLTEACYKNGIYAADDSLSRIAVKYFDETGELEYKYRSHYSSAMVNLAAARLQQSFPDALSSYEIALEADCTLWIAKSAEVLARINHEGFIFPESLKFGEIAIDNYERAYLDSSVIRLKISKAQTLGMAGQSDKALALLDSIFIEHPEILRDTVLSFQYHSTLLPQLVKLKLWEKASLETAILEQPEIRKKLKVTDYKNLADVYLHNNRKDKASETLSEMKRMGKTSADKYYIAKTNCLYQALYGDFESLKKAAESLKIAADLFGIDTYNVSLLSEESVYNQLKRSQAEKESQLKTFLLYLSAAIFLLILCVIFTLFYYRHRCRQDVIERIFRQSGGSQAVFELDKAQLLSFLSNLKSSDAPGRISSAENPGNSGQKNEERPEVEEHDIINTVTETSHDESKMEKIFRLRDFLREDIEYELNEMGNLYADYFENSDKRSAAPNARDIYRRISQFRNGDTLRRLDQYNEMLYGGCLEQIYSSGILNDRENMLLRLSAAGISRDTISLLTGISYSNFYTMRKRIIDRLSASNIPEKGTAIAVLTEYVERQKKRSSKK